MWFFKKLSDRDKIRNVIKNYIGVVLDGRDHSAYVSALSGVNEEPSSLVLSMNRIYKDTPVIFVHGACCGCKRGGKPIINCFGCSYLKHNQKEDDFMFSRMIKNTDIDRVIDDELIRMKK